MKKQCVQTSLLATMPYRRVPATAASSLLLLAHTRKRKGERKACECRGGQSLQREIGRLRAALRTVAGVTATQRGFALVPRIAPEVVEVVEAIEAQGVLDEFQAAVLEEQARDA